MLSQMPSDTAESLSDLLEYPEDRAGGIMTTLVEKAAEDETAGAVLARLAELTDHRVDIDAVAVVSSDGRLRRDVPVLELAVAGAGARMGTLGGDDQPVTVTPDASLSQVAERFIEARRLSIVVTEEGRPVGRILADDVVDALLPAKGRLHRPRWLQ
jgi:Mg/Co/Ni transporter MgtE